jgi:hypothetical protein
LSRKNVEISSSTSIAARVWQRTQHNGLLLKGQGSVKIQKKGKEHKVLFLRTELVLLLMDGRNSVVLKKECGNFIVDLDNGKGWRRKRHNDIVGNIFNFVVLADRYGWLSYARFSDVDGNSGRSKENSRFGGLRVDSCM